MFSRKAVEPTFFHAVQYNSAGCLIFAVMISGIFPFGTLLFVATNWKTVSSKIFTDLLGIAVCMPLTFISPALLIAFIIWQRERSFKQKCVRTNGVIHHMEIQIQEGTVGNSRANHIVSYTFPEGKGIYHQTVRAADYQRLRIADAVPVLYLPTDPSQSCMEGLKTPWFPL